MCKHSAAFYIPVMNIPYIFDASKICIYVHAHKDFGSNLKLDSHVSCCYVATNMYVYILKYSFTYLALRSF
jgi:hypothetical protein